MKPLSPSAFHFMQEASECSPVPGDAEVILRPSSSGATGIGLSNHNLECDRRESLDERQRAVDERERDVEQ